LLYIGIDLGTSATKLLLVNKTGEILNSVSKEYPIIYPKSGWSEQNPEEWWNAVKTGIPELLKGFNGKEVNGIGVAGQMHGLVVLDESDNIIRNVILWNDGDLELRYNMVQPIRFAVSFHRGSMQYMKEDYYIEHEYELINFSDLIRAEPIFESDIPIGDLFKVV